MTTDSYSVAKLKLWKRLILSDVILRLSMLVEQNILGTFFKIQYILIAGNHIIVYCFYVSTESLRNVRVKLESYLQTLDMLYGSFLVYFRLIMSENIVREFCPATLFGNFLLVFGSLRYNVLRKKKESGNFNRSREKYHSVC